MNAVLPVFWRFLLSPSAMQSDHLKVHCNTYSTGWWELLCLICQVIANGQETKKAPYIIKVIHEATEINLHQNFNRETDRQQIPAWETIIHILKKQRGCVNCMQPRHYTSLTWYIYPTSLNLTHLFLLPHSIPIIPDILPIQPILPLKEPALLRSVSLPTVYQSMKIKWNSSHWPVNLYCKNQQRPLGSHFTLKMEAVQICETLAIQPTSTHGHLPKTGSTIALNCHEICNIFLSHITIPVRHLNTEMWSCNGHNQGSTNIMVYSPMASGKLWLMDGKWFHAIYIRNADAFFGYNIHEPDKKYSLLV